MFFDLAVAADFDSDGWMESLIGDTPMFVDSDLDRLIFTTPPPPVPVPAPAVAPVDVVAQPQAVAPASLPQAAAMPAVCSSPSSLDTSCSNPSSHAPVLRS